MSLDLTTLVVVLVALNVVIGVALAFMSSPSRGSGALWYWSLALLSLVGASLALVVRDIVPLIVSVMLGNALIIYALELIGETASCLADVTLKRTSRRIFTIITAPVLGVLFLTVDAIWPRTLYMAAVEAFLVGQLALQLRAARKSRARRPHQSVFAFEYILWVLFAEQCIRTVAVLILTPDELLGGPALISMVFLLAILMIVMGTLVLVWHEMEVRSSAVELARTTDPESGLPNRLMFFQQLEAWLSERDVVAKGTVALIQIRPLRVEGLSVDPYQEAFVFESVGQQIARRLQASDLLARVSMDKFAVLSRNRDLAASDGLIRNLLAELRTQGVAVENGRCAVEGAAALAACSSMMASAAEAVRLLHAGLAGVTVDEVKVLRYEFPGGNS